jgi:predicted kinase
MKTNTKLILMCGIPRAGKSSWIKKNKKDCIIVSPDDIRKEIFGHQFHAEANKFVFAIAEAMVSLLLKQGKNVIVDATHITEAVIKSWYPIYKKYEPLVEVVWVYVSKDKEKNLEECLKRNAKSPDGEKLPEEALTRMAMYFESPDDYYTPSNWYRLTEYRSV